MKTAQLRQIVLRILQDEDCYGYEIHKKLASKKTEIEIGRLYKILKEMLTEGTLSCRWERSEKGPEKRVYKISQQGREELCQILIDAIDTIHSYYFEYLLNLPAKISVFEDLAKKIAPTSKSDCKIAFYTRRVSAMHEELLASVQKRLPKSEICIIQPIIDTSLKEKNKIFLQGDYLNIPLRAKYVDLLVLEGLPSFKDSPKAVEEWFRVIRERGRLVVITPQAIFSNLKDPLTIGDFTEKTEHQSTNKDRPVSGRHLQYVLGKYFEKVQRREILHMVVLLANARRET